MILRKKYTPRAFAPLVQNALLRHQRFNIWAAPGFGKTVMTYTALDCMYLCGLETRPTLVLAPLRVARDTWPDEVQKWEHLRDMTVSAVVGSPDERRWALRQDAMIYTMNYDNLPWLIDHLGSNWPFGTVVADESTRIKSFRLRQGGKRAHALSQVAWTHVNRWINLTGTPAPNGLKDLWGQMWFIDQGKRLGTSFNAFYERWFHTLRDGRTVVPFPNAQREIEERCKDVCLTLDPKDWFDIKDPIVSTIRVKLPPAAMRVYREFEDTMFTELACGTELEVFNAAALTNKCLQIANGCVYHGTEKKHVHDAKLEALESLIEELGVPVLVAYQFISDKDRICKWFGNKVALLSETSGMKKFKAGDAQIGLTHPASLGHGVDGLQNYSNVLIRFGHDWNLENRLQMAERIGPVRQAQAGLDRPVFHYDIVADETIDDTVIARHVSKLSVMQLLMGAMKGVKLNV